MAFRDATGTVAWVLLVASASHISVSDGSLPTTWSLKSDIITGTKSPASRLTLHLTPISCAQACSCYDWCSTVVTYGPEGRCELLESQWSMASLSTPDTRYMLWERQDSSAQSWCPVDAGFMLFPAVQFCVLVVDNVSATWEDSRKECRRQNLELAVPDTTFKMNTLLNALSLIPGKDSQKFNIGATRPIGSLSGPWTGDEANFKWVTGVPVDKDFLLPFWAPHEPNNNEKTQNCLTISGDKGFLLNDFYCSQQIPFICEKAPLEQFFP